MERIDTEEAARFYRQGDQRYAVTPAVLENSTSYLADDPMQFLDTVVDELHLLQRHWRQGGLPLLLLPISDDLLAKNEQAILDLLRECQKRIRRWRAGADRPGFGVDAARSVAHASTGLERSAL